jgi:hypothetical protein
MDEWRLESHFRLMELQLRTTICRLWWLGLRLGSSARRGDLFRKSRLLRWLGWWLKASARRGDLLRKSRLLRWLGWWLKASARRGDLFRKSGLQGQLRRDIQRSDRCILLASFHWRHWMRWSSNLTWHPIKILYPPFVTVSSWKMVSSSFPMLSLSFLLPFLHAPFFLKQFCCNILIKGTCRIPRGSGASRTPMQGISEPEASSICLLSPLHLFNLLFNLSITNTQLHRLDR